MKYINKPIDNEDLIDAALCLWETNLNDQQDDIHNWLKDHKDGSIVDARRNCGLLAPLVHNTYMQLKRMRTPNKGYNYDEPFDFEYLPALCELFMEGWIGATDLLSDKYAQQDLVTRMFYLYCLETDK